jgi:ribosomal protein L30
MAEEIKETKATAAAETKEKKATAKKPAAKKAAAPKAETEKKPAAKKAPAKKPAAEKAETAEKPATKKAAAKKAVAGLNIRLAKSTSGRGKEQIAVAHSLGLKKPGDVTVQPDNAATAGKIAKISHLVVVTKA